MNELQEVKEISKPDEIMLVVDAMTGQDAVNVAQSFDDQLDVSGVTLTKLDGDTRRCCIIYTFGDSETY